MRPTKEQSTDTPISRGDLVHEVIETLKYNLLRRLCLETGELFKKTWTAVSMDAGLSLTICPLGPLSIPKLVKATLSRLTTLPRPLKSRRRKWSRRVKLPGAFVEAPDQGIAKIFCPKNGGAYIRAHKYKHRESQDIPTISLVQSVAKGNPFLY